MSYKYHNQQRKRKWAEQGTSFSPAFIQQVGRLCTDPDSTAALRSLAQELHKFTQIQFTFGEVEDLKEVLAIFTKGLENDGFGNQLSIAVSLLVEVIFAENSRPLHRNILALFKKMQAPEQQGIVERTLQQRILAEATTYLEQRNSTADCQTGTTPRVVLGQTLASLLWLPTFAEWIQPVAVPSVQAIASSTHHVLKCANDGYPIAPSLMSEMQDAISALYVIIQKHGDDMANSEQGRIALVETAHAMIFSLQGQILVREAMASAAVVAWSAVSCPKIPTLHTTTLFAQGLFLTAQQLAAGYVLRPAQGSTNADAAYLSVVEAALVQQGSDLAQEVSRFSPVGKICALKGLVTVIPAAAMCTRLVVAQTGNTTPATDAAPDMDQDGSSLLKLGSSLTFLVEGALAFGCAQVQAAPDAHYKFHASCVANACMAQLLEAWRQGPDFLDGNAPPDFNGSALTTLLNMLWTNLEEPLAQVLRQVQGIFDMLLELVQLQQSNQAQAHSHPHTSGSLNNVDANELLERIVQQLVAVPYTRKGRYGRLASVVQHYGAAKLLTFHPALVREALQAMQEETASTTGTVFLKALLEKLRSECNDNSVFAPGCEAAPAGDACPGVEARATAAWQSWWMPALLDVLLSSNEKLRFQVSIHALPAILTLQPSTLITLINKIQACASNSASPASQYCTGALVSLLRVARQLQLIADLDTLSKCKKALGMDVEKVLLEAVIDGSEVVRVDCLELVASNPRQTEAPGLLELKVIKRWLSSCLRSTSAGQRNRCIALMSKLMTRIKVAVTAIHNRAGNRSAGATGGRFAGALKGRSVHAALGLVQDDVQQPTSSAADTGPVDAIAEARRADAGSLEALQDFCTWTSRTMIGYLYPGAPFERKYLAIEVLNAMLAAFPANDDSDVKKGGAKQAGCSTAAQQAPKFQAFCPGFFSPQVVQLLLVNAIDSWDKLRQAASSSLLRLPTPWPGIDTPSGLLPLVTWAFSLVVSPRLREADAGSRVMKLVFAKYVTELRWHIQFGSSITITTPEAWTQARQSTGSTTSKHEEQLAATCTFMSSLLDLVESKCEVAEQEDEKLGMLQACRSAFVHGPFLLLRYAVEEVRWSQLAGCAPQAAATLTALVDRMATLMERSADVAVPPLAAPVDGVGAEDVDGADVDFDGNADGNDPGEDVSGCGPDAQVIITGCWLSLKEVSLLAGTMAHFIPLSDQSSAAATQTTAATEPTPKKKAPKAGSSADVNGSSTSGTGGLLTQAMAVRLGQLLVQRIELIVKHNGVTDKCNMAITTLGGKLLRSPNVAMSRLPKQFMELVMQKIISPGQCRDDIIRRSAGIPLAVQALVRAEPPNTPKHLLNRSMRQLLAIASGGAPSYWTASTSRAAVTQQEDNDTQADDVMESDDEDTAAMDANQASAQCSSPSWPTADSAEPWPRVHAFNCLRHLFNDSQLAVDTSGYTAQGIEACINALGDSWWEVRNAATLCFTALVTRVLGFKNVVKGEVPKRAVTAAEFFQRYPGLHTFLLAQLKEAVQQLEEDARKVYGHACTGNTPVEAMPKLHPSLYPILILLSRLRPGPPSDSKGSAPNPSLSPSHFAPLIHKCCLAKHYAIRQLVARALAPLIPSEQLLPALVTLSSKIQGCNRDNPCQAVAAARSRAEAAYAEQVAAWQAAHMIALPADTAATSAGQPDLFSTCNAQQGVLMQIEGLLQYNVLPQQVDSVLQLMDPCLTEAMSQTQHQAAATNQSSAVQVSLLRACQATLDLMQPRHCATYSSFTTRVTEHCQRLITACNESHTDSQMTDFLDPMRSVMLKDAARIATDTALVCSSTHQPSSLIGRPVNTQQQQACSQGLISALGTCLQSSSMDVRAGGAKAAASVLQTLVSHVGLTSSSSAISESKKSTGFESTASIASADRWAVISHHWLQQSKQDTNTAHLEGVVREHLKTESFYKVRKRLLRVLQCLHALNQLTAKPVPATATSAHTALQQVQEMQCVLTKARGVEEASEALRCLGLALAACTATCQVEASAGVDSTLAEALTAFCTELEARTLATEPDDVRLAAADALASSQLLAMATQRDDDAHGLCTASLRCWLVALRLSEDDNDRVRIVACNLMQAAMHGDSRIHEGAPSTAASFVHVEAAQRLALEYISEKFSRHPALPAALCDLIVPQNETLPQGLLESVAERHAPDSSQISGNTEGVASAVVDQASSQVQGRIFDAEADNQHEEVLFVAQLAASSVRKVLGQCQSTAQHAWQGVLRKRAEHGLQDVVQVLKVVFPDAGANENLNTSATRMNQAVQHPFIFPYIFRRLLLASVAITACHEAAALGQESSTLSQLVSVLRTLGSVGAVQGALTCFQDLDTSANSRAPIWNELGRLFLVDC